MLIHTIRTTVAHLGILTSPTTPHLTAMPESPDHHQRFFGYPKPIKGPTIPYKKAEDANPVIRGTLLVVGAWLYVHVPFTPILYMTNNFQCIQTRLCSKFPME